jgi:lactate dehydrogenase-like 2-hydroxyacid dehydrogenase
MLASLAARGIIGLPMSILLLNPSPVTEELLRANGLAALRAWEAPDLDAELHRVGPSVRGLASSYAARVDATLLDKLPRLEIVAHFGVGYDTVDVAAAAARGVVITNTPDVLTEEVADTALGLLLCAVRELPQADRYLRAGSWMRGPYRLTDTLQGKTVGIFGLGRIGKAIARRCEAFGLGIAYHGRTRQPRAPYRYCASLLALAGEADVLVVTAPATAETRNAVDAGVLAALGPTGVLINVARGSLVDEEALVRALSSGTIRGAGLDVFAREPHVPDELMAMDNVVLLPHVGSASIATRNAMATLVAENLVSWFAGRGPLTPVPETPYPRASR